MQNAGHIKHTGQMCAARTAPVWISAVQPAETISEGSCPPRGGCGPANLPDCNFGRSIDPATNTYDNLKTFNNSYAVTASWTIFSGGRTINAFREAKMRMRQASHNVRNCEDEAAIAVMEAYVNLQYYRALVEITASKLDESRRLLEKSLKMKARK